MWCFHDRLKQYTFKDGTTIKCCVDCTLFDNKRAEVLLAPTLLEPTNLEDIHWSFVLEEAGLSDKVSWCDGNHLVQHGGSLQDLAKIPTTEIGMFIPDYWDGKETFTSVLPTLKRLYDQRRIDAAKRYTVLDDNEHVDRAKPFPHTGTMPRALHNFCPRCSTYATADHDGCEGNKLEHISKMREQEHNRQLRNASITLSDPTTLAPSQILVKKGGYGKD